MPAAKFEIKRKCKVCGQEFIAKTIELWYYVSVKERRNHVCEIGKEDCGGNDIATDVSNAENIKSDTSVCCDRGQLPLSLISVNNVQGENES